MEQEKIKEYFLKNNILGIEKTVKNWMYESLDRKLEEVLPEIGGSIRESEDESDVESEESEEESDDEEELNEALTAIEDDEERRWVQQLHFTARSVGAIDGTYEEGVYHTIIRSKDAANDFASYLENCECVDEYEMNVLNIDATQDGYEADMEYDFEKIKDDSLFAFEFIVYLHPEFFAFDPVEVEFDADEEIQQENTTYITEIRRKIKMNFRGKKRIKMQCAKGFKYNAGKRVCEKIGGAELAKKRKSTKRAILTKKAMGASFQARVNRKTKKAMKFRKGLGLH